MNVQPQSWEDVMTLAHAQEWAALKKEHLLRFGVEPVMQGHHPLVWLPVLRACLQRGIHMEQTKKKTTPPEEVADRQNI
ncbi:MAG: hypothetical protein NTY53_14410 [Kiritimatiellaeota bacterium]|nr:hypothetical protein [Kiritimatiellota bacterium]